MKTINDYAELVKEKHALNKTIAPVETDLTDASRGYHIGEQFIIDGGLFKAKTEIAQHDALVLNTNYEPADNLTEQIKNAGGGTGTDPRLDVFENNIAPVEIDETDASKAYQVGEQLILNNILYDVIAPISEHDVITTTGSGANIAPADPISSQFQTLTNELDNEVETRAKLGAHNLLPNDITTQTISGVTFTKNADGSVSLSGTANADIYYNLDGTVGNTNSGWVELEVGKTYIFSGGDSEAAYGKATLSLYLSRVNGSNAWINSYDSVSNRTISITLNTKIVASIYIKSGIDTSGYTFKPMIRLASDTDSTYQPYAKTNRELTEDTNAIEPMLNVLGAKNLLKNTASSATVNGITFTVNSDGSVTANGTATAIAVFYIATGTWDSPKDIILSGCPNGGSVDTYALELATYAQYDTGNGLEKNGVTVYNTRIRIASGYTANNLVFKPMIRPASIEDNTYVPYAMTNRELTEHITKADLYARKGGYEEVAVSVTTSDTMGSKIADLCAAILTKIQSLESDEYAEVSHIQGQNLNQQTPLSLSQYKSNATSFAADFTRVTPANDGSYFVLEQTLMRASSANVKMSNSAFYVNGTNTVTARENTNFTANGTIKAFIQIYKKI